MKSFYCESIPRKYSLILESILQEGKQVGPRGMKTMELSPVYMEMTNPRERMFGHGHRKEVSIFTYIEGLWILMGESRPERLVHYVPRMVDFVNSRGFLDGAYGPAIGNQFELVYERLKADPDTRQAIVTINQPSLHQLPTKDYPCTLNFQFLIRDGKLDMISHMRSQDAWLGLIYDSGEFQWFQEIMAGWLNLELGRYMHFVGSLHLYEKDWGPATDLVINGDKCIYEKYNVKPLDAGLFKENFAIEIEALATYEEQCRTGNFNPDIFLGSDTEKSFYTTLADVIAAYNLRLAGRKEEALAMIDHLTTDLALIYKDRWNDAVHKA